jgi:hypothetical protein
MHRRSSVVSLVVVIALLLCVAGATAEGPEPAAVAAVPMGTTFTYQGRLVDGVGFATGTYDFELKLFDEGTGGTQLGSTLLQTIDVVDGYFTAALDFGGVFNGDARYLEIAVRPTGVGSYTLLNPRQALTPVPYALALPGLWTQQNSDHPNLIGGYSGNSVTSGAVGAAIGGGGESPAPNRVTDSYGVVDGGGGNQAGNANVDPTDAMYATVGGGRSNAAWAEGATVGGGVENEASGKYAAIAGGGGPGSANVASGDWATVGGGLGNSADGSTATVGGGQHNRAGNVHATVAGGFTNAATGDGAAVGGGGNNIASAIGATVGGGQWNIASGGWATVAGGTGNRATGAHATVPGGKSAVASAYGQLAYASGQFASGGDAQTSVYVLRNATTDAAQATLFLDGLGSQVIVASGQTVTFDVLVVARSDVAVSAGYRIQGVIENSTGTTTFLGSPTVTVLGEDVAAWDASVVADDTNDALAIHVTGAVGTAIRWVATVRTAEVAW